MLEDAYPIDQLEILGCCPAFSTRARTFEIDKVGR